MNGQGGGMNNWLLARSKKMQKINPQKSESMILILEPLKL